MVPPLARIIIGRILPEKPPLAPPIIGLLMVLCGGSIGLIGCGTGLGLGLGLGGMGGMRGGTGAIGLGIKNLLSLSSGSLSMDIKSFIVSLFSKPLISGLSIIGLSVIERGGGGSINSSGLKKSSERLIPGPKPLSSRVVL
jgi:hypothetical protein